VTCNAYNSKIGDGQAVYDIASHTIYIYSPDILYNRTLHHEKVHAKHHSYKIVRALFFRKIAFLLGITACIFIQFLTSLLVAAIASMIILGLSLMEEFYTQRKTKKWFKNFLQNGSEKGVIEEKAVIKTGHTDKFPQVK
jgi:hypothetical protein